jgi:mannose-6-phosphate isomerase-like protein (cupin superfamily)
MITRSRYARVMPYQTRDGSEIRELMHPRVQGNRLQSLAEARVAPGTATRLHLHRRSEELYHVVAGQGLMTLGRRRFPVTAGDTVCIPPGTPHRVHNPGPRPLVILCCCAPAYAHADTLLL